jgi:lipopolysaccharide biosynthesis glycosyltransferase
MIINKIPVVFTADNGYVKPLSTVIASILKNSSPDVSYEFNILTTSITPDNQARITSLAYLNRNARFNFIDVSSCVKNLSLEKYPLKKQPVEMCYRLFIEELLKDYTKVIYLDSDVLVLEDLTNLFNIDISNYYAGVVHDEGVEYKLKNKKSRTIFYKPPIDYKLYFKEKLKKSCLEYFNSGVLLLNLQKMREDDISKKIWKFICYESPLEFTEQDSSNAIMEGKVLYLDGKWNMAKDAHLLASKIRNIALENYKKPAIFHYTGKTKPWLLHNGNYGYGFISDWWKYYKLTGFYEKSDDKILRKIKCRMLISDVEVINFKLFGFTVLEIFTKANGLRLTILGLKIKLRFR